MNDVDGCVSYEKPVLRIIFKEGNPDKYSQSDLSKIFENDPNYDYREIPYGGKAKFKYAGNDGFLIKIAFFYGCNGNNSMPNLAHSLTPEYELYARPSLMAWLIKLFILCIFWILFLPSFLEFYRYVKK